MNEPKKPKSREGYATPKGVVPPTPPPAEFDPRTVIERLNVWCVNGKDMYLPMPGADSDAGADDGNPVPIWNESHLKRELRLERIRSRQEEGKTSSQMDTVLSCISRERRVEFAGSLAGYPKGVHIVAGRKIAVTSSCKLIVPMPGDWPMIRTFLENRLRDGEIDQLPHLLAWLKQAVTSLRNGERRPGHLLVLVGGSDSGKSFTQEHLITPLLGGRASDPLRYLLGDSQFTGALFGCEHLMMQELPSGLDGKSRAMLGENLKQLIANESVPLRAMYQEPISVTPYRRVSVSLNDNVERLKTFPALTSDFSDKVILLRLNANAEPMNNGSDAGRAAFREAVERELPALVAFLLAWEIPAELRTSAHAGRFGFDAWQHPAITATLYEQEPESVVLWVIDHSGLFQGDNGQQTAWGWDSAESLRDRLMDGPHAAKLAKIFHYPGACAGYLGKLAKRNPARFESKHRKDGNVWFIRPPGK